MTFPTPSPTPPMPSATSSSPESPVPNTTITTSSSLPTTPPAAPTDSPSVLPVPTDPSSSLDLSLSALSLSEQPPLPGGGIGYTIPVPYDEYYDAGYGGGGYSYTDQWGSGASGKGTGAEGEGTKVVSAGSQELIGTTRYGSVKFFSEQKGYGFILDYKSEELGGDEVFVHYTAIQAVQAGANAFRSLSENEQVEYTLTTGPKGWQAQHVTGPNGAPCIGSAASSNLNNQGERGGGLNQSTRGGKGRGGMRGGGNGGGGGRRERGDSGFYSSYGSGMSSPSYPPIPLQQYHYPLQPPFGSPPSLPPPSLWQPNPTMGYPQPPYGYALPPPPHTQPDDRGGMGAPMMRDRSGQQPNDPYRNLPISSFYAPPMPMQGPGGEAYPMHFGEPFPPPPPHRTMEGNYPSLSQQTGYEMFGTGGGMGTGAGGMGMPAPKWPNSRPGSGTQVEKLEGAVSGEEKEK